MDNNDCVVSRDVLWPDPVVDSGEAWERAMNHFVGCPECRAFFSADRALTRRLANLVPAGAPESVRLTVQEGIGTSRADLVPRFRRRGRAAAGLSLLALSAIAVFLIIGPTAQGPVIAHLPMTASAFWDSSVNRTEGTDPRELAAWFAREVAFEMSIPEIPGGVLRGGSVADFEGHKSAAISYHVRGIPVSYVVVPASKVMDKSVLTGEGPYYMEDMGDRAVMWGSENTARLVVGNLPPPELLEIAERCRRHEIGGRPVDSIRR